MMKSIVRGKTLENDGVVVDTQTTRWSVTRNEVPTKGIATNTLEGECEMRI